jgi:1-acyl-sn-glycerol-3-phosphate acyltransferase
VIFPQGGINRKRFYRGAFFAAEKAKVPVIPVVVENPEENCNRRIRVSRIKVKFCQPLYPPSFRDKESMKIFEKEVIQKLKIEME